MLIVLRVLFVFVVFSFFTVLVFVLFSLHAFDHFLLLGGVSEGFQKIHGDKVFTGTHNCIFRPCVRFSPDVYEDV